ncbi:MAG: GNAT family N-acetyltransferase [Acutalibacteraceae bacterium]|jgi:RimJ/RimL family protein N-acetyltransferase
MTVRPATREDLPALCAVYAAARRFMKQSGNPRQWGDHKPALATIEADLDRGQLFAVVDGDVLAGCFTFILGEDPTYRVIEGGSWLNDRPYGTIHRIASDGRRSGVFAAALAFCEERANDLRIDTHVDNRVMRRLLSAHGFRHCGTIYLEDGSPRLAFQKTVR